MLRGAFPSYSRELSTKAIIISTPSSLTCSVVVALSSQFSNGIQFHLELYGIDIMQKKGADKIVMQVLQLAEG